MPDPISKPVSALVVGAGPAGLAAAEMLGDAGIAPVVTEAKPSVARKFLMAGKSGLNLTRATGLADMQARIACPPLDPILAAFGPEAVMHWAEGLGEPLFTGTSARVFPRAMKASPLLRRWLGRLSGQGAEIRTRWRWTGWDGDAACFETPDGPQRLAACVTVLALGGASWPRLGSDAAWVSWLEASGTPVRPFRPANMGFDVDWPDGFAARFAGEPVKPVGLTLGATSVRGEFVVTTTGVEGSAIYALSAALRDALAQGSCNLRLDLMPDVDVSTVTKRLSRPRGKASRATHLRKTLRLGGVRAGLLRAFGPPADADVARVAAAVKALPLPLARPRPIAEAISSAGGIAWDGVTPDLMLRARPGVFVAGEMLDWEAPTGGYLLTGCLATGRWAGAGAARRWSSF